MKRPRAGQRGTVLEQGPDGRWRAVRARFVPRAQARSERVPRPPSFRFTAAGAEDAEQLAELAIIVELFGVAANRFGAAPAAYSMHCTSNQIGSRNLT